MSNPDNAHDVDIFPDKKITKKSEPNKPSTNQDKYRERSSNFCYKNQRFVGVTEKYLKTEESLNKYDGKLFEKN